MICPECKRKAQAQETRPREDTSVRRRYECRCGHRFSTVERVVTLVRGRTGWEEHEAASAQV